MVEAEFSFPGGMPKAVRVTGPDGNEVPSQLSNGKVVFSGEAHRSTWLRREPTWSPRNPCDG